MQPELPSEILRDLVDKRGRGTQAALARSLRVKPQTVTKWMKGDVQVPTLRWLEIERALEADPLTFARRTGMLDAGLPFDEVPLDELDVAWEASFASGEQRKRAREAAGGGYPLALDLDEATEYLNAKIQADVAEHGLAGIPTILLEDDLDDPDIPENAKRIARAELDRRAGDPSTESQLVLLEVKMASHVDSMLDDRLADVLVRLEALERDVASLQESRLSLGDGEPEVPPGATAVDE